MKIKRLQKSLNRALDQQMTLLIHIACDRIAEGEPTEANEAFRRGIENLLHVEQEAKKILELP